MSGNEQSFQKAMNEGHSAAWDGLWDRAAVFYRRALEEFPDHPKALTSLGLALYELEQYDESLKIYSRAALISINDPLPLEKMAQLSEKLANMEGLTTASLRAAELYLNRREVDKAIENLSRVSRLVPENLRARARLALIFERMGRKQQAVIEFLAMASILQEGGDMEKAVQSVNHALQISPESSEAHRALDLLRKSEQLPKPTQSRGVTRPLRLSQVRQLEEPKSSDRLSTSLDPISEARKKAMSRLAEMLFDQADEGESASREQRRGFQDIMHGTADKLPLQSYDQTKIMFHLRQAMDLQANDQNAQAIEELKHAMDAGLDDPAANFDIGLMLARTEDFESAVHNLNRAVKHPDFALGTRLLLGQTYQKMERVDEAAIEYLEALKLADAQVVSSDEADDLRELYEPLIEAESHQKDGEAKVRLCGNVEELLCRSDWQLHLSQARQDLPVSFEGGPPRPLGEILTEASSSEIIESIASIHKLARGGFLRSAMEESFRALLYAPTYLPLHVYMGELLLQQDLLQEAIDKFTVIAQTYSARGKSTRAVEILRRIIHLAPMELATRQRLIMQLINRGQVEEAIIEYLEMADVHYNLADLKRARTTYTEALRLAQKSKVDQPLRIRILHKMADIDLQSLDWRQALRVYEQIRTLQPGDRQACARLIDLNFRLAQGSQAMSELNNFISHLQSRGQNEEAIVFFEDLVQDYPDRIIVHQRLTELYQQEDRVADAITHLDSLGQKLMASGDRAGAAEVIESILALDPPNSELYRRSLAKLQGGGEGNP